MIKIDAVMLVDMKVHVTCYAHRLAFPLDTSTCEHLFQRLSTAIHAQHEVQEAEGYQIFIQQA